MPMNAIARTTRPVPPSSHTRRHVQNMTTADRKMPAAASVSFGAMLIGIHGRLEEINQDREKLRAAGLDTSALDAAEAAIHSSLLR